MADFTTVKNECISEMKTLQKEIASLDVMENCFGELTSDEIIKRQRYKQRLSELIENL